MYKLEETAAAFADSVFDAHGDPGASYPEVLQVLIKALWAGYDAGYEDGKEEAYQKAAEDAAGEDI